MYIHFNALGLDFCAEVEYYAATEDDNSGVDFTNLTCNDKDAGFLLASAVLSQLEDAACAAAEKQYQAELADMRLDEQIQNYCF